MEVKQKVNNVINTTNGYKTKGTVFVMLLITIFGNKFPFIIDNKEEITVAIDALLVSGLLHDLWRNRKKIWAWITSIFSKK